MTSGRGRPCSWSVAATARRSAARRWRDRPCPASWWGRPVRWRSEPSDALPVPVGGAYGLNVVAAGHEVALVIDVQRQLREGAGGRAEDRFGALRDVELRLVARTEDPAGLLLVERDRAAGVGADLRVGHVLAIREALLGLPGLQGVHLL